MSGTTTTDPVEQRVVAQVSRRLLPLLFLLFIVCFIDRTNVGFAALQMNRDLGFGPAVYGLGAGIFFLGYALFEVPSNLILARVGARRWIARIAVTWGLIAAATMFVRSPAGFYGMRLLLGVAEAGFFPGIVYYLTHWFPEEQRGRALSRFTIAVPFANGLGGPLGGALLGLDGRLGLAGWQWLFLVEGLPAVILGLIAVRYLTDMPENARWLAPGDRAWLRNRLDRERHDQAGAARPTLREAFASAAVWRLSLPYFLMGVTSYALSLWLPLLLRDVAGVAEGRIGWVLLGVGAASAAGMLLLGWHSDRRSERIGHAAGTLAVAAVGCALAAISRDPLIIIAGLTLGIGGAIAFLPVFWCLPPRYLTTGAMAGGIALINSLGNLGGFVGPNILGLVREYTAGFTAGLLTLAGLTLVAALLTLWLPRGLASKSA